MLIDTFKNNSNLAVIGSSVIEFNEKNSISRIKKNPIYNKEILNYSKYRNPMNHPSVMFKKDAVIDSGNYIEYRLNEDYFLWVRMLLKVYFFYNLTYPLLKMRINKNTYIRRGGYNYFITQNKIYYFLLKNRHINILEYTFGFMNRFVFRVLLPSSIRALIYEFVLRKRY
jgi:hypothetical protein